jgi:hypothetical protein
VELNRIVGFAVFYRYWVDVTILGLTERQIVRV